MELLCYHCNLPGHFRKDCLTQFDVRMMTMDELQEVLENRMALLDAAPPDPPRLPEVSPEVTVMRFVRSMHEQTKNNKQCDKGALYVLVLITKSSWAEVRQIK